VTKGKFVKDIERITELEEKINQGSTNVDEYIELGSLYIESGQHSNFLKLHKKTEKLPLSKLEMAVLHYDKGEALKLSNRIEESSSSFKKSLQAIPPKDDSADALSLKGLNHHNLFLILQDSKESHQHAKDAIRCFELLVKQYPNYEDKHRIYLYLADTHEKLGEYESSLHYNNLALEISSNNYELVWALTGMATTYGMAKKYRESEDYFTKALRKANKSVPTSKIYYEQGKVYFEGNDLTKADKAFRNALKYKKDHPELKDNQEYEIDILWHLGTIAYELDNEKDIIKYFEKVLECIDNSHYYYANSHLSLGHFFMMKKDYIKARKHYSKVLTAPHAADGEIKMAKEWLAELPSN
jgi:tetratricopeptide (TPR) repeat protein